jgi:hypothetical protein
MRKVGIISSAALLLTSVAIAGENVTQNENNVQEKTVHSTTMQKDANQPGMKQSQSTTVEKQRETATSGQMGDEITNKRLEEMEKKSSATSTSEETKAHSPGAVQEHHQHSETHHQHSTTEVEKK